MKEHDTHPNIFPASRFMAKEATTSSILSLSRLTNGLHPFVEKHRFYPWTDDEGIDQEIDFEVIEQSCRLASAILASGVLDPFFKAILLPKTFWQDPDDETEWAVEYDSHFPATVDERHREDLGEILHAVARATKWCVMPCLLTTDDIDGARTHQKGRADVVLLECPYGYESVVQISPKMYDALAAAHRKGDDVPLLLTLRFEFAVMLLHEIAHVVHNFAFGKLVQEPSFNGKGVAEIGYELDNFLFGGHLTRMYPYYDPSGEDTLLLHKHDGKKSSLAGLLVLWEYPYRGLIEEYRKDSMELEVGGAHQARNIRDLDVAWRVSEKIVPGEGAGVLRPDWEVGYCFRRDGKGERVPVLGSDDDDMYVRPGFQRLKKGEIVPRHGKKAQAEREAGGDGDVEREKSNSSSGLKRKWIYAPVVDGAGDAESPELKRVKTS